MDIQILKNKINDRIASFSNELGCKEAIILHNLNVDSYYDEYDDAKIDDYKVTYSINPQYLQLADNVGLDLYKFSKDAGLAFMDCFVELFPKNRMIDFHGAPEYPSDKWHLTIGLRKVA